MSRDGGFSHQGRVESVETSVGTRRSWNSDILLFLLRSAALEHQRRTGHRYGSQARTTSTTVSFPRVVIMRRTFAGKTDTGTETAS